MCEQDVLLALFQCGYLSMTSNITSVFRFSPHICKHGAVYKRQQLPNYQSIPAKCNAVVKRQWHLYVPTGVEIK